jgi:putative hydrolase of HD superfamily
VTARAEAIVDSVLALDSLAELPRTGWLLRGVRPCESIADHSFGVALVTMYLVDALRAGGDAVDGERALRMALVHDAPEARMGDVPMPVKTPALDAALADAEAALAAALLPAAQHELWLELEQARSLEARLVRAADKIHMLVKALAYARQGRGELAEFWAQPRTFDDRGVALVREVFDVLRARAPRPRG